MFAQKVFNQFICENNIKKILKKFRINKKKEFFNVSQDLAIQTIKEVSNRELFLLNRFFDTTIVFQDIQLLAVALRKI